MSINDGYDKISRHFLFLAAKIFPLSQNIDNIFSNFLTFNKNILTFNDVYYREYFDIVILGTKLSL